MRLLCRFFFIVILFFASMNAFGSDGSSPIIKLEQGVQTEKFGQKLSFFYDPESKLDLDNVLVALKRKEWRDVTEERPNWGFRDGKLWLHGYFQTPSGATEDWVFDLGFHFFMVANLYTKHADGSWRVSKAGKSEPFANRELAFRNPAFVIRPKQQPQEFVLELQTPAVLKIPGRFVPMTKFASDPSQFVFALYVGIVLALSIFHFLLGIIAKERVYFLYLLYAAATLMTICDIEGYSYRYLWNGFPWWFVRSATIMASLSGVFGLLFANEFISPRQIFRRLIFTMVSLQCVFMVVVFAEVSAPVLLVSHFMLAAAVLLIMTVSVWESARSNSSARVFLGAFAIFGVGLIVFTLQNMGFVSSNILTQHGVGIGQAAEILMLSVALSMRINEIKSRSIENEFRNLRLADRVEAARWFAHESRRPYQGILLGIENILSKITDSDAKLSLLTLRSQARRALAGINTLAHNLVFGNAEMTRPREVQARDIIRPAIDEILDSHRGKSVEIETEIPEDCLLNVDPEQMIRVFVNLISNAVEASAANETVLVRFSKDQVSRLLVCSVVNVGKKLPEGDIGRIFEAGYSHHKSGGMGLGLAMVQKIIKMHGSEVTVVSQPCLEPRLQFAKHGSLFKTTFSFSLMSLSLSSSRVRCDVYDLSSNEMLPDSQKVKHADHGALRILLVDDDPVYLKELELLCLRTLPASAVKAVPNPHDGLSIARDFEPHCAIVDFDFGQEQQNGLWLVERLREVIPKCRIVLHSGNENQNLREQALGVGAFDLVPKPFLQRRLLEIVTLLINTENGSSVFGNQLPLLCVVDDELNLVKRCFSAVSDAEVKFFTTPDQFLDFIDLNKGECNRIQAVVSDYYFDGFNATQIRFVRAIKKSGYLGPVFLFSNVPMTGDVGKEFDARLEKSDVTSLKFLLEMLKSPP